MGGGSSELRALAGRLDELDVAVKKIERMLVLRGDRLARAEKVVNELDASLHKLNDKVGPMDMHKLLERVAALEAAAKPRPTSSRRRDAEAKKAAKPTSTKRRDAEAGG